MTLALPSPTPIDAFERRDEWRFALVLLALVAAQGGTVTHEGSLVSAPSSGGRPRSSPPAGAIAPRRGVRPPRSC